MFGMRRMRRRMSKVAIVLACLTAIFWLVIIPLGVVGGIFLYKKIKKNRAAAALAAQEE